MMCISLLFVEPLTMDFNLSMSNIDIDLTDWLNNPVDKYDKPKITMIDFLNMDVQN